MGMVKEFKEFAVKGNMVDMAVGIIIGGAFGKIVSSLVSDVLMPPLGIVIGGVDFSEIVITLKKAVGDKAAVTLNIGTFIQTTIDFVIVALAMFLMVKAMNKLNRKEAEKAPPPPAPSKEEVLLGEIRDLLKKQAS